MTTTFAKFADATRGNYCTLPKLDVEILPAVRHCQGCGEELRWDPDAGPFGTGRHVHVKPDVELADGGQHYVTARTWCSYCHNDEPGTVHFHQRSWSDETECDRCGGVQGYAIGD